MKLAVDAMGGDYAPSVVIEAVAAALDDFDDVDVLLVGHQDRLGFYLEKHHIANHPRLEVVHAGEVVEMGEPSANALRAKKDASITVAAKLVRDGRADGIVTAGHTGAAVAATKVLVRMLPGIDRPAIGSIMPATVGRWILIDAGANPECQPINLAQFAIMGEAYSRLAFGIDNPRIGLLSVGGEDSKGNDLTKETFKILSGMPINFVGNVEGHDVFMRKADVVVCDGFTGNVLLKGSESLAMATMHWLKDFLTRNAFRKTGALLARNAFRDLKAMADFEEFGGAPLIGINGACIIGHGASTPKAVRNAIRVTGDFIRFGVNEKISRRVSECGIATGQ